MRIAGLQVAQVAIPRKEPFTIARGTYTIAESVLVRIHAGDLVGHGSGSPTDVTGETVPDALDSLRVLARGLKGFDFDRPGQVAERMDRMVGGHPSAKAAVDMAVYDLVSQAAGVPLHRYLGGSRDRMPTDRTIGIMDTPDAVERALRWTKEGFRALKVKVGHEWQADLDRLRAIRGAVGPVVELRIDGNQGYDWRDALSLAQGAHVLGVAFFEQPTPADDWEGMRILAESSPIPIMADEMILTPEDAKRVRWGNAANAANLKLMKHGGITGAVAVNAICESAGYPTMVGCMGEPQLSIAAGLHFALAHRNVRWIDLDSHFNLVSDPTRGLRFEAGELIAPSRPGLGIEVDFPI